VRLIICEISRQNSRYLANKCFASWSIELEFISPDFLNFQDFSSSVICDDSNVVMLHEI
jgi:hypothetical protein